MSKLMKRIAIIIFVVPVILFIIIYLGLASYYEKSFYYGTWINSIYCTGKSIEAINEKLIEQYIIEEFVIETIGTNIDGAFDEGMDNNINANEYLIKPEEINYSIDFTKELEKLQTAQNPLLWGVQLFKASNIILLPSHTFDEALVKEIVENFPFMIESKELIPNVSIVKTDNGYELEDNSKNILKTELVINKVIEKLTLGEQKISLVATECYYNIPITSQMEATQHLWTKVNEFQTFDFSYEFGPEIEQVNAQVLSEWIITNEAGEIELNEEGELPWEPEKVVEYIATLAEKYDTYNIPRVVKTTQGRYLTIEKGNYGNQLDQETESEYLIEAFQLKEGGSRIPEYTHKALYQGFDDIGDTYIEIDMTYQKMYYYHDGKLEIETPIVTGNESRRMLTPAKVCYVYYMQEKRVLVGETYRTPVDYWMAVNGNIGIHDATWRDEFGGEIYKTDGSHGCINTPYENASKLYELVEIGTPVIMFY